MYEVTEENYRQYLSYHGQTVDCCKWVIEQFGNSDGYHTIRSVRLWVDASKMFLKMENKNGH